MTIREAAQTLGISVPNVHKLIRRGTLAATMQPGSSPWYEIDNASFEAYRQARDERRKEANT